MTEVTTGVRSAQDAGAPPTRTRAPLGRLLRAELRWIFRRPRTLGVLGLLAVIPVIIGVSLTMVGTPPPSGDAPALIAVATGNALVLPMAALGVALGVLLPLTAAMSGADALAGEQAHGTLRGWLLAPVSRGRLLAVKAFGVAVFVVSAVLLMALTGVLTGLAINGTGSLVTLSGTTLSPAAALGRVLLAVAWVAVQLWAVGAVALAISATTEHPMLVVASVLGGVIVFSVLSVLDALDWLHPFLLNESWTLQLADLLRDPVPATGLVESAVRAACYIAIGLSLAYARLATKDG